MNEVRAVGLEKGMRIYLFSWGNSVIHGKVKIGAILYTGSKDGKLHTKGNTSNQQLRVVRVYGFIEKIKQLNQARVNKIKFINPIHLFKIYKAKSIETEVI